MDLQQLVTKKKALLEKLLPKHQKASDKFMKLESKRLWYAAKIIELEKKIERKLAKSQ